VFNHVNITFNQTDNLVVYAPEYFRKMAAKLNQTPSRTIANYMLWRLTTHRVANLPKAVQDIEKGYHKVRNSLIKLLIV